jgi:cobalamin biosynthesis protein CobT
MKNPCSAFVILAHHDSVHVLSAEFTTAYLVYLRGGPESWIHVRYTRSFKLRNINDRLAAAVVVLALLYYVKETFGADDEAEEDSEDAEEGADDEAEEDSGDAEEGEGDEELGDNGDEVDDVEGEEDAKEEDDKDWPEEEEEESDRDNGDIDEEQRHVLESDVDARKRKRRRLEA